MSETTDARLTGFVLRYRRLVRAVIATVGGRRLRESGDDVEQQVWMAIWRRLHDEQAIDHPTSYVYTVARREAIRAVQEELGRLRRLEGVTDGAPATTGDPHLQAVGRETGERIKAALAQLSPDRRRAIQSHLTGLNVHEIMDLFGWSYDRARNLIARGRADLRDILQRSDDRD